MVPLFPEFLPNLIVHFPLLEGIAKTLLLKPAVPQLPLELLQPEQKLGKKVSPGWRLPSGSLQLALPSTSAPWESPRRNVT